MNLWRLWEAVSTSVEQCIQKVGISESLTRSEASLQFRRSIYVTRYLERWDAGYQKGQPGRGVDVGNDAGVESAECHQTTPWPAIRSGNEVDKCSLEGW